MTRANGIVPAHNAQVMIVVRRGNAPADGVLDHSYRLAAALDSAGRSCTVREVPRARRTPIGWLRSVRSLSRGLGVKRPIVIFQHSHLMWSATGLGLGPVGLLLVLKRLRRVHVVAWLHDPYPFGGHTWPKKIRRSGQLCSLRAITALSDAVVCSVPPAQIDWLRPARKVAWCPSPSNLSTPRSQPRSGPSTTSPLRVCIFGGSQKAFDAEVEYLRRIAGGLVDRGAASAFVFVGFGSKGVATSLARVGAPVIVEHHGVLPDRELIDAMDSCDIMLNVRSHISSRHGSVAAGLALGLPVFGWHGIETDPFIGRSGVVLATEGDCDSLAGSIKRVCTNVAEYRRLSRQAIHASSTWLGWAECSLVVNRILHRVTSTS